MIERASTDLPEPDSPTMPSVRPRSRVSDTPSTARTSPPGVRKAVRSSVTSSSRSGRRRVMRKPTGASAVAPVVGG